MRKKRLISLKLGIIVAMCQLVVGGSSCREALNVFHFPFDVIKITNLCYDKDGNSLLFSTVILQTRCE